MSEEQRNPGYEAPVLRKYGKISDLTAMNICCGGDGGGAGYNLT